MNVLDLQAALSLDISSYENELNKARRSADQFANKSESTTGKASQGFTVLKGIVSNLVSTGINVLANAITSNLGGAISRLDILNNYEIVMGNLGHDSDVAKAQIDKLSEAVNGLPTTLPAIVSVQQQFAALGGPLEDATSLTVALNNATLAGGQGQEAANSAMQQWYQMIAAGKPDMMSMRIINEAMPAQLDAIAKSVLGEKATWQDLNSEWQKNKGLTEDVKKAILDLNENGYEVAGKKVKAFKDQAIDANKGIQTSLTNIKTQIQIGLSNLIDNALGYKNVAETIEKFKEAVKAGFKGMNSFVDEVQEFGLGQAIIFEIQNAKQQVEDAFVNLISVDWKSLFETGFEKAGSALKTALNALLDFKSLQTDIQLRLMELVSFIVVGFRDAILENGDTIAEGALDFITSWITGILDNTTRMVEAVTEFIDSFLDYLAGDSSKAEDSGAKIIYSIARGIVKNVPKIMTSIAKLNLAILKAIVKIVPKLPPLAFKMIMTLGKALVGGAGKIGASARKLATKAIDKIKEGFNKAKDIGGNLVKGIGEGITNGTKWIKSRIRSWVGDVKSFLKRLFKIGSPSKWARDEIGKMIDAGMALGIENNADMVRSAMNDLLPSIGVNGFAGAVKGAGKGIKMINLTNNTNLTVSGAEDPEKWGVDFANAFEAKVRAI